jgi:hypothetical protein
MRTSRILVALAVGLVGCNSAEETPERPPGMYIPREHEKRIKFDFETDWEDIDRTKRGDLDPEQVARWVIERRNAVETCLKQSPQSIGQAMELLEDLVAKVPDSSRDRYTLAQCVFSEAAYWFRFADSYAWEMNRLRVEPRSHPSEGLPVRNLTPEEVEAKIADLRAKFDMMLVNLNERARRALNLFLVYRQQRPDDKSVYDYIFKCNFFLQNYDEARRWLELVLHEMDMAGIPRQDPLRQDYTLLLAEVKEQMADARLEGGFRKVEPTIHDRLRVGENGARPAAPRGNPQ